MKPAALTVTVTPRDGPPVDLICLPVPAEPEPPTGADILAFCICARDGEPCQGKEYADTIKEAAALWVELGTRRYDLWALARVDDPTHDVEARWHRGAGMWEAWHPVDPNAAGVRVADLTNAPTVEAIARALDDCAAVLSDVIAEIEADEFDTAIGGVLMTRQAEAARALASTIAEKGVSR